MSKKIVIIGGGVAGLTAGIYGQKNGYHTEIIEMHNTPGGQCTAWDRKGYRFDHCLNWLVGTAKGPFHDVWKETNVITDDTKIIDREVHTKIFDEQGNDFTIYSSIDRWEKYLIEMSPEDAVPIMKMCNEMRKGSVLEPFRDPPELRKPWDYLRALKKMMPALLMVMKYRKLSCGQYFQRLNLKSARLSFFFDTLYAKRNFSAIAFLMMLVWFHQRNAGYLIGGSLPLANRMAERYMSLGGTLTLGREVAKIIVEDDAACGVELANGMKVRADHVISAADGNSTIFKMLEGKYLSKKILEAYSTWPLFTPLVQVSFGINKEIETRCAFQTYLAKGRKIGSTTIATGFTIINYSFDPTMAPEGKTVLILRYESPWKLWKDLEGEAYENEKKCIETDAIVIMERYHAGIRDNIDVIDIATPKTNIRYTGVWKGAYEGFKPTSNNLGKHLLMTLPKLRKFTMCGQWLSPGGGLPPSALSGKWAIQMLCKEDKIFFG